MTLETQEQTPPPTDLELERFAQNIVERSRRVYAEMVRGNKLGKIKYLFRRNVRSPRRTI